MPYILTVWLLFQDSSLPGESWAFDSLAQCQAAQLRWDAAATRFYARQRAVGAPLTSTAVSVCEPAAARD
jgi:hypothetical protein